jgi:NADH:ubiquinone oxidoreductase subunit 6 (subunit J)
MNLFTSSSSTTTPAINSPPLGVTTIAQLSGAFTALIAAAIAVYQGFAEVDTADPMKITLIGLVGAGIIAWAIAAAGDSLARAYAAARQDVESSHSSNVGPARVASGPGSRAPVS